MKSKTRESMIYILLIYLIAGAVLFFYQRKLIYFPTGKIRHSYELLKLENGKETLEVIVLNPGKNKALLYFGGNAEAVVHNAVDFLTAFPLHTVYLFNYRGYGGSSGQPTEEGIYSDALSLFDKVQEKQAIISVMGRSLGSGAATYLASKRSVEKMVLVSPYDSIKSVAQNKFPIYPMFLLLKDKYDSIGRVKEIQAKTIILMAENDEVIPKKHSLRLISEFPPEQITVKTISNTGHNDISNKMEYYDHLRSFLNN